MILLLLVGAAATGQPQAATPRAFLERTYASYGHANFNPFDHLDRYFAPRLIAAIREDSRLAHGEVGYVDGDPICQCQDPAGLHAKVTHVTPQGPSKAKAEVILDWTDSRARRVRFSLLRTAGGWRIADVVSGDESSFLRAVEDSNHKARRGKH
jgi:hypothetical protein